MHSTPAAGREMEHRVQLNATARWTPTAGRETEHRVQLNATARWTPTAGRETAHRVQLNATARWTPTAGRETEPHVQRCRDQGRDRKFLVELGSHHATANGRRSGDHPTGQQACEGQHCEGQHCEGQHPGDQQPRNPLTCRDPLPRDRSPFLPPDVLAKPFRDSCQQQRSCQPQVWPTAATRRRICQPRSSQRQACQPARRSPAWRPRPGLDADQATLACESCTFREIHVEIEMH